MVEGNNSTVLVWTIGHGNLPLDLFVDLLRRHEPPISRLIDVRSAPYSRFCPHFNRHSLEAELAGAGIDYRFAGDYLGGRPTDPGLYLSGEVPTGKADYLHLVDYPAVARSGRFQIGLERLVDLARECPSAIMCSEGNPHICHRHHLIAKALVDRGVAVFHIRHNGSETVAAFTDAPSAVPTQSELFA